IDEGPFQTNIKTDGFQLNWTTNEASSTIVRYGLTEAMGSEISIDESVSEHTVELKDLQPAEFYYVQTVSVKDGFEAVSPIRLFSTASLSSGEIQVYFNQSIDTSFSNSNEEVPLSSSPTGIEEALLARINAAKNSIDVCVYNTDLNMFVDALSAAYNRGVQVRYINNDGSSNVGLIPDPSFPVLSVNRDALMHNKYVVIDAASTNDSWVLTGSLNFTQGNLFADYNNMVFIQDEALAKAYTWEFEEIWGGDQAQPNPTKSRAGAFKKNNTPHQFMINGKLVESYFSPSDNTTSAIVNAIQTADTDLEFAVLSFTRDEIGTAVKAAKNRGVKTRGIIESSADQGSEFSFLKNAGVDIVTHQPDPLFHHKYAIIDASNSSSDPMVITGSHNWSSSAENRNDENTLIIHDANVANLFIQEFEARWKEVGTTAVQLVPNIKGVELDLFPIPVTNQLRVDVKTRFAKKLSLKFWSLNGQLLKTVDLSAPLQKLIDLQELSNGLYIVTLQSDKEMMMRKIEVLR
ncbi:MAG TPA: T9SS type A sorting domain-containing protein, partial [Saprospiraceae bacterium]|nr:T9SS type A sorting domain-containing protein [Saprospiraceae bacterium]